MITGHAGGKVTSDRISGFPVDAGPGSGLHGRASQILDHTNTLWPAAKAFLKEIVGINSFTFHADGVRENAKIISRHFASFGFGEHILPSSLAGSGDHLILDSGGEGQTILLISHLDTVYPPGEQSAGYPGWDESQPRIVGPGTYDIKGGTIAIWLLMECLRHFEPQLFGRIRWILAWNAAEERLNDDFSTCVKGMLPAEPLACLVFEGDNKRREGFEIITSRSGMAIYNISIRGRSTHSGNGHAHGVNAILKLSELVCDVANLTDYRRNTTLNVGVIRGGDSTNRVPDFAEAQLEVRYRDPIHYAEVKAALMALRDGGDLEASLPGSRCEVVVTLLDEIPLWREDGGGSELAELWLSAGATCGQKLTANCRSGLSDANYFASAVRTLDGLGPRGGNPHSVIKSPSAVKITEFVDQSSFAIKNQINTLAVIELMETGVRKENGAG
jgi:glutamate carboxypeptidase